MLDHGKGSVPIVKQQTSGRVIQKFNLTCHTLTGALFQSLGQ